MKTKLIIPLLMLVMSTSVLIAQNDRDKEGEYHLDENYSISANGTVHMKTADANIKIIGSSRSDVHLTIDRYEEVRGISSRRRGSFGVDVEERSGDLYITEKENRGVSVRMGYVRIDYDIEIEVPENTSLRLKGDDDDYIIRNVNGNITMDLDDGDMEVIDCKGDKLDFNFQDGDLKMDGVQGQLFVRADDGDVDIRNANFEDIDMSVEDGNIYIETSLANDGQYDFRGDDADFELSISQGGGAFLISHDDGRVRTSAEFDVLSESDHRSRVELSGGKSSVEIRIQDGTVRLSTSR